MDLDGLDAVRSLRAARAMGKGARSRRKILDAATELLSTKGAGGLSIPDIASLAGISKASVYYYFSDIGQLAQEVVGEQLDLLAGAFEQAALGARSAHDALVRITDAFIGMLRENWVMLRFLLGEVHFIGDPASASAGAIDVRDRLLRLISTQLERGKAEGSVRPDVDPDVSAASILGVFLAVAAYGIGEGEDAFSEQRLKSSICSFIGSGVSTAGWDASGEC